MNLAQLAPQWAAWLLIALLAAAAIEDSIRLRISNITTAAIAVLAVETALELGIETSVWQNLLVCAIFLAVGTFLFSAGMFGGGDIKLIAATGLWFSLNGAWRMVLLVLLAGGVVTVVIVLLRLFGWPDGWRKNVAVLRPKGGIPYGIAIAVGAVAMILIQR